MIGSFEGAVVIHGTAAWGTIRSADQSLARALCKHVPVVFIDPPVSRLTVLRRPDLADTFHGPPIELLAPNLVRARTRAPIGKDRPGIRLATDHRVRRTVQRVVRQLGATIGVEVAAIPHHRVFTHRGDAHLRAYWATDDHRAGGALVGIDPARIATMEDDLVAASDHVLASSPELRDLWRARGRDTILLPNAVDLDAFDVLDAQPADDVKLPADRPVAGYLGTVADRIDFDLLHGVVDAGCSLLMVGGARDGLDRGELDQLLQRPGVQWTGHRPYDELASYLRHVDVGLVPYVDDDYNRASFPLKILEYLAAGLPVVSTDLPAARWLRSDQVRMAGTPAAFGAAAVEAVRCDDGAAREARRQLASAHSWDQRAVHFLTELSLVDLHHAAA